MRGVKKAVTPKEKNGILWLDFNYKPSFQERRTLKSVGFRWSPSRGMWWCKNTRTAREVAGKLNLTEFIPVPAPTEQDFMDWQKSLKHADWCSLVTQGEALTEDIADKAERLQIFDNMLHEQFVKQWA